MWRRLFHTKTIEIYENQPTSAICRHYLGPLVFFTKHVLSVTCMAGCGAHVAHHQPQSLTRRRPRISNTRGLRMRGGTWCVNTDGAISCEIDSLTPCFDIYSIGASRINTWCSKHVPLKHVELTWRDVTSAKPRA